jgi:hypothetical protein
MRHAVVASLDLTARSNPANPEHYIETASNLGNDIATIDLETTPGPELGRNGAGDNNGEYPYVPLGHDQIRILVVYAGARNSELDCALVVRRIPKLYARMSKGENEKQVYPNEYEALSYCWGGQKAKHPIRIRGENHASHTLLVTGNLLDALRALRYHPPSRPRYFWVDAICINQKSPPEKNQQLPLMSRIYSQANKVCVWLGPESETNKASLAFDLMHKLRIVRNFDEVVEEQTTCDEWLAFAALIKRSWFSRRWVVQEITVARRAELHCGHKSIPWKDFAEAVALFELMSDRVKKKFRTDPSQDQQPDIFGDIRELSASRLVAVTSNIVAKGDDGQVEKNISTLEALVSDLTPFQATRPHDIVYALLSLAKDVSSSASTQSTQTSNQPSPDFEGRSQRDVQEFDPKKFPVDYGKEFPEVCKDFLTFTIKQSNSLDIICRPWAPVEEKSLPSWIRTLAEAPFGRDRNGHWDRINANTLVGMPGQSPYKASGSDCGIWSFGNHDKTPFLSVEGFKLDDILDVEDAARSGVIPSDWLEHGNLPDVPLDRDEKTGEVAESFWRTIVADKGPDGRNPPPCVCEKLFTNIVENNDVNLGHIHDRSLLDVEDAARSGVILSDWLKYGNLADVPLDRDKKTSKVAESFWRTMVAGKGPDGRNPPPYYSCVCEKTFTNIVENSDVNLGQIHDRSRNTLERAYIKRVQSVVWGRKLTKTKLHKRLALVPRTAKRHDFICILLGCSVPVVLRHTGKRKSTDGKDFYQLIGESYVYGMMDGEAFDIVKAKMAESSKKHNYYKKQTFNIK